MIMDKIFLPKPGSLAKTIILTALLFCTLNVFGQGSDAIVDSSLRTLKDVMIVSKLIKYQPYSLEYQLAIKQPLDHDDTTKGFFYQQLRLAHRDFSKPMIMQTEGYNGREPAS